MYPNKQYHHQQLNHVIVVCILLSLHMIMLDGVRIVDSRPVVSYSIFFVENNVERNTVSLVTVVVVSISI